MNGPFAVQSAPRLPLQHVLSVPVRTLMSDQTMTLLRAVSLFGPDEGTLE